MLFSITH